MGLSRKTAQQLAREFHKSFRRGENVERLAQRLSKKRRTLLRQLGECKQYGFISSDEYSLFVHGGRARTASSSKEENDREEADQGPPQRCTSGRRAIAPVREPSVQNGYRIGDAKVPCLIFDNVQALGQQSYALPLVAAKIMVKLYADLGAGLQLRELADFFGIDVGLLQAIKIRMGLTHKSPDVVDVELEQLSLSDMFNRAGQSLADKRLIYRIARIVKERQETRKELERLRAQEDFEERFIQAVLERVNELTEPVAPPPFKPPAVGDGIHVMNFFDWHVGEAFANQAVGSPYTKEIMQDRLAKITVQWEARAARGHASTCYVVFGGDMMHSPTGATGHGTKLPPMDPIGTEQILFAKRRCEECLHVAMRNYRRVVTVFIKGGNHDSDDLNRFDWLYMIGKILEHQYANTGIEFIATRASAVKLQLSPYIQMVIDHGYKIPQPSTETKNIPSSKLVPAERLMHIFGMNARFNYIVRGDKHTRGYREHTHVEEVAVGSLVGGDPFSIDTMQAISRPSQTLLYFDPEHGLIDHTFLYGN